MCVCVCVYRCVCVCWTMHWIVAWFTGVCVGDIKRFGVCAGDIKSLLVFVLEILRVYWCLCWRY